VNDCCNDPIEQQQMNKNQFYVFEYRFIKFEYKHESRRFEPIVFDTEMPFDELRAKYCNFDKLMSPSARTF